MFDLVYTNAEHEEQGVLSAYNYDAAWGEDENNFELELSAKNEIEFGAFVYIDGTQIGGVVDSKSPDGTSGLAKVTYRGRTWHGILVYSILQPDSGESYLSYSGDANDVIRMVISRQGLSDVFECVGSSGINVSGRFDRYVNAYEGLMKMLSRDADKAGRLDFVKQPAGKVRLQAVEVSRFTDEIDSDRYRFKSTIDKRPVNHLICLGSGELAQREVLHLYADQNGGITETQTLFGIDEKAEKYEYSNADSAKLREEGIKKLTELQKTSGFEMKLPDNDGFAQVGDIVGALDNMTGLYAESFVTKVIVSVNESGFASYSYDVGNLTVAKASSGGGGGGGVAPSGDYVSKTGDTMTGPLEIVQDGQALRVISPEIKTGQIPTTGKYSNINFVDSSGMSVGFLRGGVDTEGNAYFRISASNESQKDPSKTTQAASFYLKISPSGERIVDLGNTKEAWQEALGFGAAVAQNCTFESGFSGTAICYKFGPIVVLRVYNVTPTSSKTYGASSGVKFATVPSDCKPPAYVYTNVTIGNLYTGQMHVSSAGAVSLQRVSNGTSYYSGTGAISGTLVWAVV